MDVGVMVAEQEAGEDREAPRQKVEINPFWSSGEVALQPEEYEDDEGRRDQRLWEEVCRRTRTQERKELTAGSGRQAPLTLDWVWIDEHKVWVPELPQREDDDELIGELDLAHEMEKNFIKACRKIRGLEQQWKYLFGIIEQGQANNSRNMFSGYVVLRTFSQSCIVEAGVSLADRQTAHV